MNLACLVHAPACSAIRARVLAHAVGNLKVHGALGALLRCQHLQVRAACACLGCCS